MCTFSLPMLQMVRLLKFVDQLLVFVFPAVEGLLERRRLALLAATASPAAAALGLGFLGLLIRQLTMLAPPTAEGFLHVCQGTLGLHHRSNSRRVY